MAEVTIDLIKKLREKTGGGISLCKEALTACGGDIEEAEMYLRKKDKDKAAKRSERATGQGVVFSKVSDDGKTGTMVEVACETDFVAKNDKFQALGKEIVAAFENAESLDNALELDINGMSLKNKMEEAVATIGENMKVKAIAKIKAGDSGLIGLYEHFNQKASSMVVMELDGVDASNEKIKELSRDVCMHITSVRPIGLVKEDISEDLVNKEKEVYKEEVKGKPEEIQEKILMGKLGKFFSTKCLTEQGFVKDDKIKVKKHVDEVAKAEGGKAELKGFIRFELGLPAVVINGEKVEME